MLFLLLLPLHVFGQRCPELALQKCISCPYPTSRKQHTPTIILSSHHSMQLIGLVCLLLQEITPRYGPPDRARLQTPRALSRGGAGGNILTTSGHSSGGTRVYIRTRQSQETLQTRSRQLGVAGESRNSGSHPSQAEVVSVAAASAAVVVVVVSVVALQEGLGRITATPLRRCRCACVREGVRVHRETIVWQGDNIRLAMTSVSGGCLGGGVARGVGEDHRNPAAWVQVCVRLWVLVHQELEGARVERGVGRVTATPRLWCLRGCRCACACGCAHMEAAHVERGVGKNHRNPAVMVFLHACRCACVCEFAYMKNPLEGSARVRGKGALHN